MKILDVPCPSTYEAYKREGTEEQRAGRGNEGGEQGGRKQGMEKRGGGGGSDEERKQREEVMKRESRGRK